MIEKTKALLDEMLPVRGTRVSYEKGSPWGEFLDVVMQDEHGLRAVLRLIVFDEDGATIRDIKDQVVVLVPSAAGEVSPERLEAYFRGWAAALDTVVKGAPVRLLETLMPHDLAAPKVLALKKAKTADDFREAFLAKSRLGRLLAPA